MEKRKNCLTNCHYMWLLIVIGVIALGVFFALSFDLVLPLRAETLLRVRKGSVDVCRGHLKPYAKEHINDILGEAGLSRGLIAITKDRRVIFSRHIPSNIHQRLRNVLLNQPT